MADINNPLTTKTLSTPQSSDPNSPNSSAGSAESGLLGVHGGEHEDATEKPAKRRRLSSYDTSSPPPTTVPKVLLNPSPAPSHDVSHVPNHISSLDHVAKQIHAAATEAWDRRFSYHNVFALLLYWDDDDLDVAPEVVALESTLRHVYHYTTETWKIPTIKPDWDIKERLIRFLRANDALGNLVLFYYAGHAIPNPQSGGAPLWSS